MATRPLALAGLAILAPVVVLTMAFGARFVLPALGIDAAAMLMQAAVPRIAKDLPKRLDRYVIWEAVEVEGARAVFTYRLDITSHDSSTREFLNGVQNNMPKAVCGQVVLRSIVWLGGGVSFQFYDGRNNMLRRIDLDPGSCTV